MEIYPLTQEGLEKLANKLKRRSRLWKRGEYSEVILQDHIINEFAYSYQKEDVEPGFRKQIKDKRSKSRVVDLNFIKAFEKKICDVTRSSRFTIQDLVGKDYAALVESYKEVMADQVTSYIITYGNLNYIDDYIKKPLENPLDTARDFVDLLFQDTIQYLTKEEIKKYLRENLKDLMLKTGLIKEKNSKYKADKKVLESILNVSIPCSTPSFLKNIEGKRYIFGVKSGKDGIVTINPKKIRQECLDDYIAYCKDKLDSNKPKEGKKIEFAKGILNNDFDLVVEDYLKYLYKETKHKLKGKVGKKGEGLTLKNLVKDKEIKELLESVAFEELKTLLQSKRIEDKQKDSLELVLEKYRPEVYEKEIFGENYQEVEVPEVEKPIGFLKPFFKHLFRPLGKSAKKVAYNIYKSDDEGSAIGFISGFGKFMFHSLTLPIRLPYSFIKRNENNGYDLRLDDINFDVYELEVSRDPKKVKESAMATNSSCISNYSLGDFRRWVSDPGTIFLIAKQNGRFKGYVRNFLMKDQDDNLVLAVDTMEPPGKRFQEYIGLVNAMGLATVQLGLDIGARYIVANDSRIRYGPREAFGNKEKRMKLKKIGKKGDIITYRFNASGGEHCPHVLMENWRK